jgi:hypothetical protein
MSLLVPLAWLFNFVGKEGQAQSLVFGLLLVLSESASDGNAYCFDVCDSL